LASDRVLPHRFSYYFVCPEDYASFHKVAALRDWLLQQGGDFLPPPVSTPKTLKTAGARRKPQ